jgi:carbamoyl-phosphate synthase small subunit
VSLPAVLALADGTIFRGQSIGAKGNTTGEVVFNTALTGYQEILTDPSYARQIVTLTCPHIGNTGTTPEDLESPQIYCSSAVASWPSLASTRASSRASCARRARRPAAS